MVRPSAAVAPALLGVQPFPAAPTLDKRTVLRFRIPLVVSQINASSPEAEVPCPTTIEPSAEIPKASLTNEPPTKSPRPTMPLPLVQRNASAPAAELPRP